MLTDLLFVWILKYLVITFLILGVAVVLLEIFKQPVERISLIKITFGSLLIAAVIAASNGLPRFNLGLLQVDDGSEIAMNESETVGPDLAIDLDSTRDIEQSNHINSLRTEALDSDSNVTDDVVSGSAGDVAMPIATEPATNGIAGLWKQAKPSVVPTTIVLLWACSVLNFLYILVGFWYTKRLVRRSLPLEGDQLTNVRNILNQVAGVETANIGIRSSQQLRVPIVHGLLRPVIILPESLFLAGVDQTKLKHCLAHEWKHLKQKDLATWELASWLQPFLWMQPGYWFLLRELRVSQDQVADQFSAQITNQPIDYAETLMDFARANHPRMLGALSMSGSKSNLSRRVEMLLNPKFKFNRMSRRTVILGLVAVMMTGSVLLASIQIASAGVKEPFATNESLASAEQEKTQHKSKDGKDKKDDAKPKVTQSREWHGVVSDKTTGAPVEGAVVTVRRENSKTKKIIDETKHTTDAEGKYSFEVAPEQANERYLYIELDVQHETYCSKKGFGYSYSMIIKNEKLGEAPFYSDVKISPGESVQGRVIDPAGNPLRGIEVSGYSKPPTKKNEYEYGSFDKTTTVDDGKFKLNFAKDGNSILWIRPKQFAMQQIMTGTKRGDLGDIKLKPGLEVSGKIVDARGKEVPNVWVEMTDRDASQEIQMPVATSMEVRVKTDEHGRYRMQPMRPAKYSLKVTDAGQSLDENGRKYWERIKLPGVFSSLEFELNESNAYDEFNVKGIPHVYVKGRFVNSKGEPTSGHMPHGFGKMNGKYVNFQGVKGEKKGDFEVLVPHGIEDMKISFITNEHSSLKIRRGDGPYSTNTRDINLGNVEEDVDDIEIVRYVAPIIQIQVTDESGEQIDDALVGAWYPNESDGEIHRYTKGIDSTMSFEKQKDGYHRSSQLAADTECEFFAELEGYVCEPVKLTMQEEETRKVTIVMKKGDSKKQVATRRAKMHKTEMKMEAERMKANKNEK